MKQHTATGLIRSSPACRWLIPRRLRLVWTCQDLVPDQHSDSAGPAFVAAGEICLLLVEKFAGLGIANLNHDVVVSLGDSSHNPDKRLVGPELQRDAGFAVTVFAVTLLASMMRYRPEWANS